MTKPTKLQERACDGLAEALVLITEGARLDGRSAFDKGDLHEVAARLARASSAFGLDVIVARALERRGRALGLRPGTAELLTLMDAGLPPLEMLLLDDDEFRRLVETVEEELGEI